MNKNEIILKDAILSDDRKYRYALSRIWDVTKGKVMFIMLNPSKADETEDDPTIRRCIGFAKSWGYGGIVVCNLFAYRSTDPKGLLKADNPFGDKNIFITRKLVDEVSIVVCAWGNSHIIKKFKGFSPSSHLEFCRDKMYHLGFTKQGWPTHPLFLRSELKPIKMFND